ncbi:hypothetical protein [Leifsonia aquatica]|uniref:hypothetical protein n=1 Tax=Leifsonia aquatica TaxID=144185 RepID=UPI0004686EA0|nr:hypothetical protein [Leifsonia aquatica]
MTNTAERETHADASAPVTLPARKFFALGTEDLLGGEHIGRVIYLEHFMRIDRFGSRNSKELRVRSKTHIGTVAAVVEHRGTREYGDIESLRQADNSDFPDYHVEVIFADGTHIFIHERDTANVTVVEA